MLQELLKDSSILFAIYMFGYVTYIILGGTVAIWNLYRNRLRERMKNKLDHDFYFPVSILVPAFNEEKTIISTINNLLDLDYKIFEIIVMMMAQRTIPLRRLLKTIIFRKMICLYVFRCHVRKLRKYIVEI